MWKIDHHIHPETGKEYTTWAKVYDTPSQYGINGGRISKLEVLERKTGRLLYNYDRGPDMDTDSLEVKDIVNKTLEMYQH